MSDVEETWEQAAVNPDPVTDLGYVYEPLTTIYVEEDGEQYLFLPGENEHLTDAEFIIAAPGAVCDLANHR